MAALALQLFVNLNKLLGTSSVLTQSSFAKSLVDLVKKHEPSLLDGHDVSNAHTAAVSAFALSLGFDQLRHDQPQSEWIAPLANVLASALSLADENLESLDAREVHIILQAHESYQRYLRYIKSQHASLVYEPNRIRGVDDFMPAQECSLESEPSVLDDENVNWDRVLPDNAASEEPEAVFVADPHYETVSQLQGGEVLYPPAFALAQDEPLDLSQVSFEKPDVLPPVPTQWSIPSLTPTESPLKASVALPWSEPEALNGSDPSLLSLQETPSHSLTDITSGADFKGPGLFEDRLVVRDFTHPSESSVPSNWDHYPNHLTSPPTEETHSETGSVLTEQTEPASLTDVPQGWIKSEEDQKKGGLGAFFWGVLFPPMGLFCAGLAWGRKSSRNFWISCLGIVVGLTIWGYIASQFMLRS